MSSGADFLHELDARGYAVFNLVTFFGVLVVLVGATFASGAGELDWWVWTLAVIGGINLVFCVAVFVPLVVRGGTYRVAIKGDCLRVDSPHRIFGRSFEVALPAVARLVVRKNDDGPDGHEVHTRTGQVFELDACFTGKHHLPAEKLFEAIRRLHPQIPVEEQS
jgi:hypothetical protein